MKRLLEHVSTKLSHDKRTFFDGALAANGDLGIGLTLQLLVRGTARADDESHEAIVRVLVNRNEDLGVHLLRTEALFSNHTQPSHD